MNDIAEILEFCNEDRYISILKENTSIDDSMTEIKERIDKTIRSNNGLHKIIRCIRFICAMMSIINISAMAVKASVGYFGNIEEDKMTKLLSISFGISMSAITTIGIGYFFRYLCYAIYKSRDIKAISECLSAVNSALYKTQNEENRVYLIQAKQQLEENLIKSKNIMPPGY